MPLPPLMKKPLFFLCLLGALVMNTAAQPLRRVPPQRVGLDPVHLAYADTAIEAAIAHGEIPGAVLAVVRHGKMAYLKAYGNRQVWPDTLPMTTGTVFDMASCTKPMATAVSVLQLAEQGRLRMLDAVNRYLPGFADWQPEGGAATEPIRILHLMTHTSGLHPYVDVEAVARRYGSPCPDGLMEYISTMPRDFAPATGFQYSCLNYVTLQHIVETITGQSLSDYAATHIFQPLGMEHTGYNEWRMENGGKMEDEELAAQGELPSAGNSQFSNLKSQFPQCNNSPFPQAKSSQFSIINSPFSIAPTTRQADGTVLRGVVHDPLARVLNGGISGNAGLFSTADDVAIFCAALQNGGEWNGHRILSPRTVEAMRSVPREVASFGRTLGWDCFTAYASCNGDFFSPQTYSHTGFTGTSIVIDPVTDTSVILLINAVHPEEGHSVVRLRSLISNIVSASIVR